MKNLIKIICLLLIPFCTAAQNPIYNTPTEQRANSLLINLKNTDNDTIRMALQAELAPYYFNKNIDSSIFYGQQALVIAKKLKLKLWQAYINNSIGYAYYLKGRYVTALQILLKALKISADKDIEKNIWKISSFYQIPNAYKARMNVFAYTQLNLAFVYAISGNIQKQKENFLEGISIGENINDPATIGIFKMNLATLYYYNNMPDSALLTAKSALENLTAASILKYNGYILNNIGDIYASKNKYDSAEMYYRNGIVMNQKQELQRGLLISYKSFSKYFLKKGNIDSSILYANKVIDLSTHLNVTLNLFDMYETMAEAYHLRGENDKAYQYLKLAGSYKDSLFNKQKINQIQDIGFNERFHKQELEKERIQYQNKMRTYAMLGVILVFIIIAFLLYRNSRIRRKANEELQQQKKEIEEQKKNVEFTLSELKAAQTQLIHSEKMASLGELTAGIAHEIQNPLNFVNNFSEVNKEMIAELKEEIAKGNYEEVKIIASDIESNEEKINHHGKRAEGIVKGMLQHSRKSEGKKEPTDINALCDEYLRLSYHGLRAKDKSFNANFETDFDTSIEKINIVPQDMGRVILNLINNAFYAVSERKKLSADSYQPLVSIKTRKVNDKIEILVADNGGGIPDAIKEKIFQPFFTTKPTGQGTGLGLSLSYDIIKAHGGEIKVESRFGEETAPAGTTFIIQLPKS